MTTGTWPPAPTAEHPWQDRELWVRDAKAGAPVTSQVVRVREVTLWGRVVLLNADEDAVWCPRHCNRFIPVDDLHALWSHVGSPGISSPTFRDRYESARPRTVRDEQW